MPNLYEIANELVMAEAQFMAEGEDVDEAVMKATLDGLNMEFDEMGEHILKRIRNLEGEADEDAGRAKPFQEEAEFYLKRARTKLNKAQRYKKYLILCLTLRQEKEHGFGPFTAKLQASSKPSCEIVNLDRVPDKYARMVKQIMRDEAIRDFMQTGEEIPGLAFEHSYFLRIR
jgi:hypothetical protein